MDRRSLTSAINGRKGGRKKGSATIERERVKSYIAERIAQDIEPMIDKMIHKVLKGDVFAFKELLDRGFGRPNVAVDITSGGIPIPLFDYVNKTLDALRDHNSNEENKRLE